MLIKERKLKKGHTCVVKRRVLGLVGAEILLKKNQPLCPDGYLAAKLLYSNDTTCLNTISLGFQVKYKPQNKVHEITAKVITQEPGDTPMMGLVRLLSHQCGTSHVA